MKFNIYKEDMYENYKVDEVEAGTADEALKEYLENNRITDEDEASRYYPVDAERFYCHECNKHFDYPKMVSESRGEFWGMACSETVAYCPHCGGWEFEEVKKLSKPKTLLENVAQWDKAIEATGYIN